MRAVLAVVLLFMTNATVYAAPGDSRDNPIPLGESADVWDGRFTVRVLDYDPDATDYLLSIDEDSPEPLPGKVYALLTIEVTYHGEGSKNGVHAGPFRFVDRGNTQLTDTECGRSFSDFVRMPDESEEEKFKDLFDGGMATFNLCVQVTPDQAANLYLYITSAMVNGYDVFFALGPNVQPGATPQATPPA
jgi:hypothetical protein